eukprot:15650479-Heterocapsa_arctica.AAC.1
MTDYFVLHGSFCAGFRPSWGSTGLCKGLVTLGVVLAHFVYELTHVGRKSNEDFSLDLADDAVLGVQLVQLVEGHILQEGSGDVVAGVLEVIAGCGMHHQLLQSVAGHRRVGEWSLSLTVGKALAP